MQRIHGGVEGGKRKRQSVWARSDKNLYVEGETVNKGVSSWRPYYDTKKNLQVTEGFWMVLKIQSGQSLGRLGCGYYNGVRAWIKGRGIVWMDLVMNLFLR